MTVSDVVESLGTVVLDAVAVCERGFAAAVLGRGESSSSAAVQTHARRAAAWACRGGAGGVAEGGAAPDKRGEHLECSDEVCKQTNAATRVLCRLYV